MIKRVIGVGFIVGGLALWVMLGLLFLKTGAGAETVRRDAGEAGDSLYPGAVPESSGDRCYRVDKCRWVPGLLEIHRREEGDDARV